MRIFALIILALVATVFLSAALLSVLPLEFDQRHVTPSMTSCQQRSKIVGAIPGKGGVDIR